MKKTNLHKYLICSNFFWSFWEVACSTMLDTLYLNNVSMTLFPTFPNPPSQV